MYKIFRFVFFSHLDWFWFGWILCGLFNAKSFLYVNIKKNIYKNCRKRSSLASSKVFIRWWPWVQAWFRAEASLPLTQGAPAVFHNTTRLYWMVFNLYECHIRSDAVTVLFGIFFIYSLFFAGDSLILVKNVEVAFEIKPRHPISRGNMSVDHSFLVHCSRRSSYFSNFCWYAGWCWSRKRSLILQW